MTSNGAQRTVEKSVATKAETSTDGVPESGAKPSVTSSEVKRVESSTLDEPSPVAEAPPAEAAPTAEAAQADAAPQEAVAAAPSESSQAAEPAPTEDTAKTEAAPIAETAPADDAAKTEAAPIAETAPAEPASPAEDAAKTETALIAETAQRKEAAALVEAAEKSEASANASEAPRSEEWAAAQGAVSTPPARIESRAAPSSLPIPAIEIADEWTHPTFWSTRPNRAWMLAGGSAIVIAFLVGALTGRLVQPERSPEFVVAPSAPATESNQTAQAPAAVPLAPVAPSSAPPSATPSPAKRVPLAFNAKAAKAAIDGAAPHLKGCKRPGDPVGPATVMVTFAPAGRVSSVSVASPVYAGTRTADCIVERLRELRIPEFGGAAVTVKRSVNVR